MFRERTIDLELGDVLVRDFEEVEVVKVEPLGPSPHATVKVWVQRLRPDDDQVGSYEFWTSPGSMNTVVGE